MIESQDRRTSRTRRWLRSAFMELVLEKPYENITIQDITDRADTARITFYRHYKDKEELLLDCLEAIYRELLEHLPELSVARMLKPDEPTPILTLYRYIADNHKLYRIILGGQVSALVSRQLRQFIVEAIISTIQKDPTSAPLPMPIDVFANYLASGILGMIVWWLEADQPYPVEYLARVAHWMALIGGAGITGKAAECTPPDLSFVT